jgi:predicted nucleotidyltransferase
MKPYDRIILECVVGSTVHGTSVQDGLEDLDLMAICLEAAPSFVGFAPVDTWIERTKPEGVRSEAGDTDRSIYGLRKFLALALKGNPTILLAFFVPEQFIKVQTQEGRELQGLHSHIVSKQVFQPFRGYMKQQHERLLGLRGQRNVTRPELVNAHGYDTKYAGHIIRLGFQGAEILETGRMSLPMRVNERQLCLDVRSGKYKLHEVSQMIVEAEENIQKAYDKSTLPLWPNRAYVQAWMVAKYMESWNSRDIAALSTSAKEKA